MKLNLVKLLVASVAMALFAVPALAQDTYPSKPITLVVPFSPGGGTDTFARILGEKLQERLGQPVVVENKPGAGGNIGADFVAKSSADGYTLLLAQDSLTVVPWLFEDLPFDTNRDFTPIGIGVFMPMGLIVSNQVPASSLAELIEHANQHPGDLSYGTPGIGTAHHLNFELFLSQTGTDMVHIPYQGATPMMADMASGVIDVSFAALNSAMPFVQSDRVRMLAVADSQRVPLAPDVPAIAESYPGYLAHVWFGLMAPAGTPENITDRLSDDMRAVLSMSDVRERLEGLGYKVEPTTPEEMKRIMDAEHEKWGEVVKNAGISIN